MHVLTPQRQRVWINLSILYLRCIHRHNRRGGGAVHQAFNSLFEMLDKRLGAVGAEEVALSILYLRCVAVEPRGVLCHFFSFNSLFEMPRRVSRSA